MDYTKELIDEVKELYPNSEMIKLSEGGSIWLGKFLCDSIPGGIEFDKILMSNSLEELQKEAMLIKRKTDLYYKWCEQDPRKNN